MKQGGNPQNLVSFQKGQSGNPNGRPRKYVSELREQGYSNSEVADAIKVLLSMDLEELKEVYTNPKATVLEKVVASAIKKDIEKGQLHSIEMLLNRAHGKPLTNVDITSNGEKIESTFIKWGDKEIGV